MTALGSGFRRYLSPPFIEALHRLADDAGGAWWRDALHNEDLFIAIRSDELNIYHRGASLFRAFLGETGILAETHVKYLVRQQQAHAVLGDGAFSYSSGTPIWASYEPGKTLPEMIRAANRYAGPEKTGLHALIKANPRVIDVEIALSMPGNTREEADGPPADDISRRPSRRQDRIDIATLETRPDGTVWIVFHEVKHFANVELRARPDGDPPVVDQVRRYREALAKHADAIASSYQNVCQAHTAIDAMRKRSAPEGAVLDPLILRAATEGTLKVDPEPRLIVFGFDQDQRDGVWSRQKARLEGECGLTVYGIGNPKSGTTAAFDPPSARRSKS